MINLSLIAQTDKVVDINGTKITISGVDPMLQVELVEKLTDSEDLEAKDRIETYKFIFSKVITNVNYKEVNYNGSDFFNMLRITEDATMTFMNDAVTEVVKYVFLTGEEEKK